MDLIIASRVALEAAIHNALCDVSHHDAFTDCKNQREYELVTDSVVRNLANDKDVLR